MRDQVQIDAFKYLPIKASGLGFKENVDVKIIISLYITKA
jgi:hypothetical protein